jgi:hypothetical protein
MFQLAPVMISTINASCVEVVSLIRCVCFCLVAKMSNKQKQQHVDICSDLYSQLIMSCQNLSLEVKHGAFNMILKANNKVCHGNS